VLRDYYLLHASRADFLRRLERNYEATIAYQRKSGCAAFLL
jgi:predicted RNA polymerase sigma factor